MLRNMKVKSILLFLFLILLLSACSSNTPIDSNSSNIWDHYFVYPISSMIIFISEHITFGNFGMAIIIITFVVKICLIPLSLMQFKSQLRMKSIQPQLEELKKKYSSKDSKTQQEYQKEMMKLFKENNASPLNGCLPMLIQLPIFSAIYYAIMRTEEIKISNFLWVNLGHIDPYYILPIIASITMYLQIKITSVNISSEQKMQNKIAYFLSPFMILVFGCISPSGLVLYWVTGNIFGILQGYIMKVLFDSKNTNVLESSS